MLILFCFYLRHIIFYYKHTIIIIYPGICFVAKWRIYGDHLSCPCKPKIGCLRNVHNSWKWRVRGGILITKKYVLTSPTVRNPITVFFFHVLLNWLFLMKRATILFVFLISPLFFFAQLSSVSIFFCWWKGQFFQFVQLSPLPFYQIVNGFLLGICLYYGVDDFLHEALFFLLKKNDDGCCYLYVALKKIWIIIVLFHIWKQ